MSRIDPTFPSRKSIRPAKVDHPLHPLWPAIAPSLLSILDATDAVCIDVVRIGDDEDEDEDAPLVIWIGVTPETMKFELGMLIIQRCQTVLHQYPGLDDVQIELRETEVVRLMSPLLDPLRSDFEESSTRSTVARYTDAFTNTVGLRIGTETVHSRTGTSGLCLTDSCLPGKVMLLTAQHVVGPMGQIIRPSSPNGSDVSLFSTETYASYHLELEQAIDLLGRPPRISENPARVRERMAEADGLSLFRFEIKEKFDDPNDRVIGRVFATPSVRSGSIDTDTYTQDWALIELNPAIISNAGQHNRMNLRDDNDYTKATAGTGTEGPNLETPASLLLPISGLVNRRASSEGFAVLKRGATTGLTLGITSGYDSWHRRDGSWTRDLSIVGCRSSRNTQERPTFSAAGDSGSVVITLAGEVCGLVHTGARNAGADGSDITYVTPMWAIVEQMKEFGLNPVVP